MTEMEFFQVFELRPSATAPRPSLECWKRDISARYGEIIEYEPLKYNVHVGGHYVGSAATFNRALNLLIKHATKQPRKGS